MLVWLLPVAWAGNLYINGTKVEPSSVSTVTLQGVDVRFDASGNILVDAPGYQIQMVDAPPPPPPPLVTPAHYWLVTEDNGSDGHSVEVWVNGKLAITVASGEAQKILDVGRWLQPGHNDIAMKSTSIDPSGGSFYVFVGTGSADQSGTVVMDDPSVQFGLGATRRGAYGREFTLQVD